MDTRIWGKIEEESLNIRIIFTMTLLVTGILFQNAEAKNFYKAKLRLKLTHSTAFDGTRTLERESANVVLSDDSNNFYNTVSYCQLKINNNLYNCTSSFSNKRNYSIFISSEEMKNILVTNFEMSTAQVDNLKLLNQYAINRSYSSYSGHERKTEFQFHTEKNEESFHLIVVARQARKQ